MNLTAEQLKHFENQVQDLAKEHDVPGVSVALVTPEHLHTFNAGVTSITNPLPVTADTLFQIGSTTKTMTALALALLEQEGKLKLTDRVQQHLPDFRVQDEQVSAEVTILHLLTHMGGWLGDYFVETGDGDDAVRLGVEGMRDLPQLVPLGSHFGYNNAGFMVAGRVLEAVTGQTYEAALTELVLKPLGMSESLFFTREIMTRRFAAGHTKTPDGLTVNPVWSMMRACSPAGSTLSSSVNDMAKYARYLMTGEVQDKDSPLARFDRTGLWQPRVSMGYLGAGEPTHVGMAWMLNQDEHQHSIAHGGGTEGHITAFSVILSHSLAFIAHSNALHGGRFNHTLEKYLTLDLLGLPEPAEPNPTTEVHDLGELSGEYSACVIPEKENYHIALTLHEGVLHYKSPSTAETFPLMFIARDRAIITQGRLNGMALEFFRNPDGKVFALRLGVRIYPKTNPETLT